MTGDDETTDREVRLPLHAEDLRVGRRVVETGRVRVAVRPVTETVALDEMLEGVEAEVERVAIGRPVDAAPPVREEGDTLVVPVVEEVLVVERRLVLTEEVRIRRRPVTRRHRAHVEVRHEEATVERVGPRGPDDVADQPEADPQDADPQAADPQDAGGSKIA